ncbi:hypothetical protein KP001_14135 [Geomonas subterranea]|uniref:Uncharacterized protein n=1 Tax=Geomonas subterranea TaxID=2847989 RepID=A0ABX8LGV2_9BACT|nr:hypothetical protein [Geomonas subterranea]QXE89574.1 hypothetical protein KP001_14135 [Geomonas subterranea]QXM08309.1 hypothetical protein KP002_15140 [Geomonas subterranea]
MESYKEIVAIILAVATAFFYLIWFFVPPIRLVWRCLSTQENLPLLNTLKACYDSAWPFNPAMFRRQMRLWLELRLLHPKPCREPKWFLDPRTKRYQLRYDDAAFSHELAEWKRSTRAKFGALKIEDREPVIEVVDVFRLNNESTKDGIKQYLLAVSQLRLALDEQAPFLCSVKIEHGFLLPLNLLAGPMSRFADDWDPIISSYDRMAGRAFSPQQMAIFNLWLLWGASVPICSCDQWGGPVTLQYGFGDENNSVRVRVRDERKEQLLAELRKAVAGRNSGAHPALHVSITGRLWPPGSFFLGEICGAQQELLNPDREAFIIEYEGHSVIGNPASSRLFYTGYVWALFVVGRELKPGMDQVRQEPWLHVIPFFEHGNFVDESCYEMAKLQLVLKVINFVKSSGHLEADPGLAPLRLWYVCALDDSGCGRDIEVVPRGKTIRSILEELLSESEHRPLKKRIITDDRGYGQLLSGCHLSRVVSGLFDTIAEEGGAQAAGRARRGP